MKYSVRTVAFSFASFSVIMHEEDIADLGLSIGDRVRIRKGEKEEVRDVFGASGLLDRREIGICIPHTLQGSTLSEGDRVEVVPVPRPVSVHYIRKKIEGNTLSADEIRTITSDITKHVLNQVELTAWVLANYLLPVTDDEMVWMVRAMIETGETLAFEEGDRVVDKHSIGGLPGDKTSIVAVPLIAASGLLIPKTASRAITSASGTADTMEVVAEVDLSGEEIVEITRKVGGVIAWGGRTAIAPADDILIRVERHLAIDPKPQLIASILGKKGAVGARHILIDIPVGGLKVKDRKYGEDLAGDFRRIGERLGLNISCVLSDGSMPLGRTIGPALEAREALSVLEGGERPGDLIDKAIRISGILLEMGGMADDGQQHARRLLASGKALEKFRQMIEAQGGEKDIRSQDIAVGEETHEITANHGGTVGRMDNISLMKAARVAGAPKDRGAGLVLHKKTGDRVRKGDALLTLHAERGWKLEQAIRYLEDHPPLHLNA